MKFLITGGAGFIGSNLAEALIKKGDEVIVVDDLSTGSLGNINGIKDKIKFIKTSVANIISLDELKNIDGIYHLGIPSTTLLYRNDPLLVGSSINEFIVVLELAKRENCKVVYASSSSIYNGNKPPFAEDMSVLIKDFYTEARYAMERMARLYNDFYGIESIGFRFFSVYGPHEEAKKKFANLVSQFLWAMEKGMRPIIYGDGSQTRDFIYVNDVVSGFIAGMASNINCDIFNLGTSKQHSLNRLVGVLNEELGTNLEPVYQENPIKNYVQGTLADTTKVKEKLSWSAEILLEKGIKKLIEYGNSI